LKNGVPLFLSQLVDALEASASARQVALADAADGTTRINESASLHGRELLDRGFTVPQVVYGYGDVCQVVTELATEREASISTHVFHVFNLCLDDARHCRTRALRASAATHRCVFRSRSHHPFALIPS
jgi:hypothetical protein